MDSPPERFAIYDSLFFSSFGGFLNNGGYLFWMRDKDNMACAFDLPERLYIVRSMVGLMLLSSVGTMAHEGLVFQATWVIGVPNPFAAVAPCEAYMKAAFSADRSPLPARRGDIASFSEFSRGSLDAHLACFLHL